MSGYRGIVLSPIQQEQWIEALHQHQIEVDFQDGANRDNDNRDDDHVIEDSLCIRRGTQEIQALKYLKKHDGQVGIVFMSMNPKDFDLIDQVVLVLNQIEH